MTLWLRVNRNRLDAIWIEFDPTLNIDLHSLLILMVLRYSGTNGLMTSDMICLKQVSSAPFSFFSIVPWVWPERKFPEVSSRHRLSQWVGLWQRHTLMSCELHPRVLLLLIGLDEGRGDQWPHFLPGGYLNTTDTVRLWQSMAAHLMADWNQLWQMSANSIEMWHK